jgi:4-carboxymuconolactone decarboxylase
MSNNHADETFRAVLHREPTEISTPFQQVSRDFVFGEIWSRPGLSRKDRRWVALACVAGADAPGPIEAYVRAAMESGDIELEEMLEFVLHFAVYSGWPKASHLEGAVMRQWAQIHRDRGEEPAPLPTLSHDTLGPSDREERFEAGAQKFADVNLIPAPPHTTPYRHAGILNFVFGHVWQRPGLTRRERRIITVACVSFNDAITPMRNHVGSALHSGDITKAEMDEIVIQFSAYYGFAKGEALNEVVETAWSERPAALTQN